MRTIVLSPAGRQPVKIAQMMAINPPANKRNALAQFLTLHKSALLTAASILTGITSYFSAAAFAATDSRMWWLVMAISAASFFATLYPMFFGKKGGAL